MKKLSLAILILALAVAGFACKKKSEPAPTEPQVLGSSTPAEPAQPQPDADPAPAAAGEAKAYRYILEASGPGTPKMRFEYLVVPPKMNMKMTTEGQPGTVHMISDGQSYWMVMDEQKMVMKMPAEAKPEIPENMVFAPDWDEFKKAKTEGYAIEDQGKAQVNGKEMTKYLIKMPTGPAVMTVYVDGSNTVRRIETLSEGQTQAFIMDVIELELNPKTSDADFQPPAGYTVQDIPAMPGVPKQP